MPQSTPKLGLVCYDLVNDGGVYFSVFRNTLAGYTNSALTKIDDFALRIDNDVTQLKLNPPIVRVSAIKTDDFLYEVVGVTEITEYRNNVYINLSLDFTNIGTVSLNINNLGQKGVYKIGNDGLIANLSAGDLKQNKMNLFRYNGTYWVWVNAVTSDQLNVVGTVGNLTKISTNNTLEDAGVTFATTVTNNTIAQRTSTGQIKVATPVATEDASTKGYTDAVDNKIGVLTNLTTTDKTNIVNAVNEVDGKNYMYGDPVSEFENFDPINAQFLGGNAPEYYASQLSLTNGLNTKVDKTSIINDLTTGGIANVLSAQQGVELSSAIGQIQADLAMDNTIPHTQIESIKSLPVGALQGKVSNVKMDGLSLVNSVTNGDFSNGTSGWSGGLSVANKILTANSYRIYTTTVAKGTDIFFYYAKARWTQGTQPSSLQIGHTGVLAGTIPYPVQNQWYEVFQKSSNIYISSVVMQVTFLSSATSMEVDGNAGVFAINMTALGIESFTEEQMLDLVRGGYFEGLKGVERAKAKTVGKNLLRGFEVGGIDPLTGLDENRPLRIRSIGFSRCKPTTQYSIGGSLSYTWVFNYYDINKKFIGYSVGGTATTPVGCAYVRLRSGADNQNDTTADWMFNEGSTALPYEPYQSSELTIEPTLRSLPNGVKDKLFEQDGQIWLEKNVEEYVLQSADVTAIVTSSVNVDHVRINKRLDWKEYNQSNANLNRSIIQEGFSGYGYADEISYIGYLFNATTLLYGLVVPKGTYASLSAAQTAIAGTKIHYQLATPQLINLTEQGMTEGQLESFGDGACYLESDTFHSPSVEFSVPANLGAQIASLIESGNYQAKQIEGKANKVQEDWIEPTMLNGWVNYSPTTLETAGYFKDEFGFVHLKGMVKSGTINQAIFALPLGYRPKLETYSATSSNSAFGNILIDNTNGNVRCTVGNNTWVNLTGINFKAGD